ncbi:MAG: HlyD family efflux transporter periplasmic adaptor subunit [Candidatus Competibacteraceae bacterium]|nr:HlyD family efflux transporter periplasmic adaptor subunit [Candidatus Competibacteraceae bacterium]
MTIARPPLLIRLGLPIAIIALAIGSFVMLRTTRPAVPAMQSEEKAWRVTAIEIEPARYQPELLLYGTVEAPRQAELSAAIAADITQVLVAEGQLVTDQQLLVLLDERDGQLAQRQREADVAEIQALIDSELKRYRSDLAALEYDKAMLELDRRAVTRAEDLRQRKVGSESLLDEARLAFQRQALAVNARQLAIDDHSTRSAQLRARLARAEALRDQAELDLQRTRIVAPFAGRVASVPVAPGDRVRIGDSLVSLYATAELEIRAQIPFRYLPVIRASLKAGGSLLAHGQQDGRSLSARLQRLSAQAARSLGGIDALFIPIDGADSIVPGRLLRLVLQLPPQEQLVALPSSALYGLDRVYRLTDGRLAGVTVERVGERYNPDGSAQVLIRSPALQIGDQLITTQLPNAVEGLKVTTADL